MPDVRFPDVILIAGPTASGKSAAALAIAAQINGEIINADAIQVYRELEVLSARPTTEEMMEIPHHLYGHVAGQSRYSVGRWAEEVTAVIGEIAARGRSAIIVGGTGLYFRALTEGLSAMPAVPTEIRTKAQDRLSDIGLEKFRIELLRVDPAMERLAPADRQRHLRAWEVFEATGETLTSFQAMKGTPVVPSIDARIVVEPSREALYARCDKRFDLMLAGGALEEARVLDKLNIGADLPVMKALGAAELIAHLRSEVGLEGAIDLTKRNTRRFAKRQLTWFRNQTPNWARAAKSEDAVASLLSQLASSTAKVGGDN